MNKFLIPIGIFVILGALLAYGLTLDPRKIPSPLVGKPLPAFKLPTLDNPGKVLSNEDFKGRVVLLNVWASWCVACKEEHPVLVSIARSQAVPIIGLNYKDATASAKEVLRQDGDPYEVSLVDADGRTGIDWGVYGVPESFLIDKQGIIRYKHIGPISPEAWREKIAPLVKELSN